jgi:hypothetical protein
MHDLKLHVIWRCYLLNHQYATSYVFKRTLYLSGSMYERQLAPTVEHDKTHHACPIDHTSIIQLQFLRIKKSSYILRIQQSRQAMHNSKHG